METRKALALARKEAAHSIAAAILGHGGRNTNPREIEECRDLIDVELSELVREAVLAAERNPEAREVLVHP